VTTPVTIPVTLRTCRDAPYAPTTQTQRAAAQYVTGLAGSYLDCREKLGAVVSIIDKTNAIPSKP
jgi:hypothetical protein